MAKANKTSSFGLALVLSLLAACGDEKGNEFGPGVVEPDASVGDEGRPSPPYSAAWPLALATNGLHGFPAEDLSLDCDPDMFSNISPGLLRETTQALVYGAIRSIEIPGGELHPNSACEGDRWDGLRMVIEIERSIGPYVSEGSTEVTVYFPTDVLLAWTRRPWWDSSAGVARWSDWRGDSPQPVPMIGGKVLISSVPVRTVEGTGTILQAVQYFSVDPDGEVVPQTDRRGSCNVRLEIDGNVPATYGHIDTLWSRISHDPVTQAEREGAAVNHDGAPVRSDVSWVECAD